MSHKFILSLIIILVSVIYGLPNIILVYKFGQEYNPLPISGESPIARDEAFAYAPHVPQILKGNFFLKEAYTAEYANFPTPFLGETTPSLIFAILGLVTGSIEKAFVVADFIFPPIIFLLLYKLSTLFIKNKFFALSIAFLATISRDFIAVIPYPHETLQYLSFVEGQNYLLFLSRAFHPQVTFAIFLFAIIIIIQLLHNPQNKFLLLALGFVFGALFYSYLFHWTYFLLVFLLVLAYFLAKKNRTITRSLVISGLIALIVSSFYIYNSWKFSQLELSEDFVAKTSLHNLPLPLTIIRYGLIALLFLFIVGLKNHQSVILFLALFAGVVISPLSKFLVGQDLETFHYLRRALMPIATISLFITIYYTISNRKLLLSSLTLIIFMITLLLALKTQIIATEKIKDVHKKDKTQEAVFTWLKENTQPDSVIGSLDTNLNSLLPLYTQNYVYFPPTDRTIMTTNEGVDRFLIISNLLGISQVAQKKMLFDKSLLSYLFVYQAYENSRLSAESVKGEMARNRAQELYGLKWQERAKDFRMDYLIIGPNELKIAKPNPRFLTPVTSINEYLIFKYKK